MVTAGWRACFGLKDPRKTYPSDEVVGSSVGFTPAPIIRSDKERDADAIEGSSIGYNLKFKTDKALRKVKAINCKLEDAREAGASADDLHHLEEQAWDREAKLAQTAQKGHNFDKFCDEYNNGISFFKTDDKKQLKALRGMRAVRSARASARR